VIQPRHMSGAIELDRTDHHGLGPSILSWPDTAPVAPLVTHRGDSSAGNGGNGYFAGSALDHGSAVFEPINVAQAAALTWVDAYQTNMTYFDQAAIQIAGVGGNGGDENAALGGSAGSLRPLGSDAIATGARSAGNGGDGDFFGTSGDAPVVIYDPTNVAVAGSHGTALADQSNTVEFLQDATQIGGVGGNGGNSNATTSGSLFGFGVGHAAHTASIGSDVIGTGGANAGNGGDGHFSGALVDAPVVIYDPINISVAGPHGTAVADQSNTVQSFQDTTQIAGVGGNGGNANTATSGDVFGLVAGPGTNPASTGSDVGTTGGASAGNGGDGHFSGALIATPIVIYDPINIAVAGPYGTAVADQSNTVEFQQDATQIAGVGGNGGSGNTATSGEVFGSASSGAGDGGNGSFLGSLVHASFALYDPINIAVAGVHSSAHAEQTNTVSVDQAATQIAGVGGHGGSGNAELAGSVGALFSESGLIGSDVIAIGGGYAGDGGNGYFHGSLIDVDVAIYAPINIAIAGCNSTADAVQSNHALFDQSAIQIAGLGGDGGNANLALALHAVAEHHPLDHAL
jgi:hypothetical protein